MTNVFDKLIESAKKTQKRIILTETEDERVLEAAGKAAEINLCKVLKRKQLMQMLFMNLERQRV